jgi:hypothetical protein
MAEKGVTMPYYLQRIAMRQPANCFASLRKVAVPASIEPASRQIMASASIDHFVLVPHRAQAVGAA